MQLAEASEEEEQAIDRLLAELGIRLPVAEVSADGEDLPGTVYPPEPGQTLRLDEIREWLLPFS